MAAEFLGRSCGDCHSGRAPEAGLTLDAATAENMSSFINAAARQGPLGLRRWERVHDRIAAGEMPPAEAEQPSSAERAQAVAWLSGSLQAASGERHHVDRFAREKLRHVVTWTDAPVAAFATFLDRLAANASANLPVVLAGGGFAHRGHVAFSHEKNMPLSNLFLRMLHQIGVEVDAFWSSTGRLTDLG